MKKIKSIKDLLRISDEYYNYLIGKIDFDKDGWPIFSKEHFLIDNPKHVITFQNRNNKIVSDRAHTLLCFFSPDKVIYPRLCDLFYELNEYKEYIGVASTDITVTDDMDEELQELIILVNQLFMAILAVNGVKIVFNTRCGSKRSLRCFANVPQGIMCISGFLGCSVSNNYFEANKYIDKILALRPSVLIIYGKRDKWVEDELNLLGIEFIRFNDFHSLCTMARRVA